MAMDLCYVNPHGHERWRSLMRELVLREAPQWKQGVIWHRFGPRVSFPHPELGCGAVWPCSPTFASCFRENGLSVGLGVLACSRRFLPCGRTAALGLA